MPVKGPRVVVDTNVLISSLLLPDTASCKAVEKAIREGALLVSDATLEELGDVLSRKKFDPYVSLNDRKKFIRLLGRISEWVASGRRIRACRDPRDDKFLEVAVNGDANLIISGDKDLLVLNPFMGIPIASPSEYLKN